MEIEETEYFEDDTMDLKTLIVKDKENELTYVLEGRFTPIYESDEEFFNEQLSDFSDRQIVAETIGFLNLKQLRDLLIRLEKNYK